mmetsp:Transcript_11693/g.20551  ORF Transcript_11693/g.20551 Transcript_11693/m.20551 type:complete len:217 (+) Transcript_11693:107-757(+)
MTSITSDSDDDDAMVGALVYNSSITAKVKALAAAEMKKASVEVDRESSGGGDGPSMDNRDITRGRRGDSSAPELRIPLFPSRLYAMLENAADLSYSSAVSWNPDGRSFVVVPGHFKLHFRSLKHQLDLWGFKSLNQDGWFHKYFVRGNMYGLHLMQIIQTDSRSKSEKKGLVYECRHEGCTYFVKENGVCERHAAELKRRSIEASFDNLAQKEKSV